MNEASKATGDHEQICNRLLRDLTLRPAPASLESRVLEELRRRDAMPWWRRGFVLWPPAPRAAFTVVCTGIVLLTFLDSPWTAAGARALDTAAALSMNWAHPAVTVFSTVGEIVSLLGHAIPSSWLYGGLAAGATLYTALFALGAAAYRTLYLRHPATGNPP